ncbi:hypothetical protein HLH89_11375 [Rhizobium laguerreae]|uniref:hypothetical protein n=1 Tax=Rhizobium laguerreae TaxID=1076926 RepID=UPI0014785180|nr:hypothetical protein [Rhizobium laguerreae]NNH81613.1 hypothetical protein [Rhizobium laguerreae]
MNKLLDKVIAAHGGLTNWNRCRAANAIASIKGPFCPAGSTETFRQVTVIIHRNRVTVEPLGCIDCLSDLDCNRLSVTRKDGAAVMGLEDVRLAHAQFRPPIDLLTGVLMTCSTVRSLLTSPFMLGTEGVEISELVPWNEAGGQWRVLRAEFPPELSTPARVQDFFFDANFLLRRHDYDVDRGSGMTVCTIVTDYVDVAGLRMPTTLTGYPRRPDLTPDTARELISVEVSNLVFS